MSIPDRSHELIQKYLEALASEAEIAELEGLLATDPEVAVEFATAARLEAGLERYFRQQYKIDQVAALLNDPASLLSRAVGQPGERMGDPPQSDEPVKSPLPSGSTFIPRYARPIDLRRAGIARRLHAAAQHWKPIAAALLLLTLGVAIWTSRRAGDEPLRLVTGRVTIAGREVTEIPENAMFDVAGQDAAVIDLPGGARIELVTTTRATIRRDPNGLVVQLVSGGGNFHVVRNQSAIQVETAFGVVSSAGGRFSLDLAAMLPVPSSQSPTSPAPSLTVVVAKGSVTVQRGGVSTTLSAGQRQVFL